MGFSYAIGKSRLLGVNATDTKSITHHRHSHHRNHRPGSPTTKGGLKTQDNCQRPNDKGSLNGVTSIRPIQATRTPAGRPLDPRLPILESSKECPRDCFTNVGSKHEAFQ